jgi:hypothetical protein
MSTLEQVTRLTKTILKEILDNAEIPYNRNDNKPQLIELLMSADQNTLRRVLQPLNIIVENDVMQNNDVLPQAIPAQTKRPCFDDELY